MELLAATQNFVRSFDAAGIRYALIGGVAIALWGVPRNTFDLDFLVHRDDLTKLDEVMVALGYNLRHRSDNVSHFNAAESRFGSVDFLHAFRAPSLGMLRRAEKKIVFSDQILVPVLHPSDLIGLKVQAIANDSRRKLLDLDDIEQLMRLHRTTIDWEIVEDYFRLFGFDEIFQDLAEKYRETD